MTLTGGKMQQMIQDVKAATTVAVGTTATGLGTVLDIIPDDIGKLATVVGIMLSCVLIYVHLRKGSLEKKKIELEIEVLQKKR